MLNMNYTRSAPSSPRSTQKSELNNGHAKSVKGKGSLKHWVESKAGSSHSNSNIV